VDLTDLNRSALSAPNTATLALGVSNSVRDFSPLPNVKTELDAIVRQTPEKKGIYPGLKFLNQAFSFQSLRDNLVGHRIVHIATHAQFTTGRPEDSFLVLGTGDRLTIPEIQTLKDLSQVQLVVLSACETALGGPDNEGTEISGISSYFLTGGAKAVMASLWAVDDKSTSELMQQFYGNLATVESPMTKAQALRRAQLSLLYGKGGFSHPYFWAPFVITGNGF
jgi:CHAT domain-containing protein